MTEETDLLNRIIHGETKLFKIFVDKYKDSSLTIACSLLKDREEAEDVVQDSFLKAFRQLPRFNFQSTFKSWLYRIVVNTSYHALEKRKIRRSSAIDEQLVRRHPSSDTAYDTTLTNERKEAIQHVLSGMKTNEALILQLYYLGEQSLNEIVEITGMSLSNVKVTLHRGRKNFGDQLRNLIGEELDDFL
jgi:RNA polymerase sigma factor (sigma-70 family)